MMGHNMGFKGEILKIIPELSLLPLIWSTGDGSNEGSHTVSLRNGISSVLSL